MKGRAQSPVPVSVSRLIWTSVSARSALSNHEALAIFGARLIVVETGADRSRRRAALVSCTTSRFEGLRQQRIRKFEFIICEDKAQKRFVAGWSDTVACERLNNRSMGIASNIKRLLPR